MMQLPLSVLATAVPPAGAGGANGGANVAGVDAGDAASVFASLLAAMQVGQSADAHSADPLGAVLADVATEATLETGAVDGEIPSGLAALVQSLLRSQAATSPDESVGADEAASESTEEPVSTGTVAVVDSAAVSDGLVVTPASSQPEPAGPLLGVATTGPIADTTPANPSPAVVGEPGGPTGPTGGVSATPEPVEPADGLAVDQTVSVAPTDVRAANPIGVQRPETETAEPERPAAGPPPKVDGTSDDIDAATRTFDADAATAGERPVQSPTAGDDAPDTGLDQRTDNDPGVQTPIRTDDGRSAQTSMRADTGETSNQTGAAAATDGAQVALARSATDPVRPTGPEPVSAASTTVGDAAANVTAAAVSETAAPRTIERADGAATIERITLREMPTVVVDRIRAIDPQGGVNRAVVRLDPPDLGRIMLEVVSNGDEIAVIARTDSAEAARALVRQRAEIEAAVEALGLSVSDFDVKQGDSERRDAEQEARRERGFDDRRPAADTGYATTDTPTTEGELFL